MARKSIATGIKPSCTSGDSLDTKELIIELNPFQNEVGLITGRTAIWIWRRDLPRLIELLESFAREIEEPEVG